MTIEALQLVPTGEAQTLAGGHCRLCGNVLQHTVVDLGMSPLCEHFLTLQELDRAELYYPLRVFVCDRCLLVQLKEYVSSRAIFTEYAYFSSYSTSWLRHAERYCQMIVPRLNLGGHSLVVELASNDGYLLQHFVPLGVPVLGVEPAANVAQAALARNIPTRVDFFGVRLARELLVETGGADLIVGNNVLAQVPDLNDFTEGMRLLLKPHGMITLEFPHVQRLIMEGQFDTIYHEHFSYFSLFTVDWLARKHGLKVVDVEELSTHGGSLRVYLTHADSPSVANGRVANLLSREGQLGFHDPGGYLKFDEEVRGIKRNLLAFLIQAKNAGRKVCGYGAPGKGNTLLNYCGIGPDFLDFTVDRNPYKHGRFTPGMHVPIHPVEMIDQAKPDYLLILPWNLKNEIVAQMRHVADWGARFVVPIPALTVIDPKESLT